MLGQGKSYLMIIFKGLPFTFSSSLVTFILSHLRNVIKCHRSM